MLQIIGWLGCVYLVVKALEIGGSRNHRDEKGLPYGPSIAAMILAWVAAFVFAVWLLIQGGAAESALSGIR